MHAVAQAPTVVAVPRKTRVAAACVCRSKWFASSPVQEIYLKCSAVFAGAIDGNPD